MGISFVKNSRGVALMLVIASIFLLSTIISQFAFDSQIQFDLASNERDRLQAYYLAKSSLSFMKLEIKFDRMFREIVRKQGLQKFIGDQANQPLCQLFPISTGMLRTVFTPGGLAGMMGTNTGDGDDQETAVDEGVEKLQKQVSLSQEKDAMAFLDFEGDFSGECVDIATRINLNYLAVLSHSAVQEDEISPFNAYKKFITEFLEKKQYKLLFKKSGTTPSEVVDNIGDWIDGNTSIERLAGGGGGAERSLYDQLNAEYVVRDGLLLSMDELYLIDGVSDIWLEPLRNQLTIYGTGKINICTASDEIIESLIIRYVSSNSDLPSVRLDDKEQVDKIIEKVLEACADGLDKGLGQRAETNLMDAIGANKQQITAKSSKKESFASYITHESQLFGLTLIGEVGDIQVRIEVVLDVSDKKPEKWRAIYWKVF